MGDRSLEVKEALELLKNYTNMYAQKCKECKEKDEHIKNLQKTLNKIKEEKESLKFHNSRVTENVYKHSKMLEKKTLLDVEINKLYDNKMCLINTLKENFEKLKHDQRAWELKEMNWTKEFELVLENNKQLFQEEVNCVKHNMQNRKLDLEKKCSTLMKELDQNKSKYEELMLLTRNIDEEKLKKKNEELLELDNELNFWRKKKFSIQSCASLSTNDTEVEEKNEDNNDTLVQLLNLTEEFYENSELCTDIGGYDYNTVEGSPTCATKGREKRSLSSTEAQVQGGFLTASSDELSLVSKLADAKRKPQAIVSPIRKKVKFPAVKKKRFLYNPQRD